MLAKLQTVASTFRSRVHSSLANLRQNNPVAKYRALLATVAELQKQLDDLRLDVVHVDDRCDDLELQLESGDPENEWVTQETLDSTLEELDIPDKDDVQELVADMLDNLEAEVEITYSRVCRSRR